ncbi:hypothetical protein [Polaribacter aestuariivivens]
MKKNFIKINMLFLFIQVGFSQTKEVDLFSEAETLLNEKNTRKPS